MSVLFLGVSNCMYLSQLPVGPLGGQSCLALVCKHNITSVIVSYLGASTWDGSQYGQSQNHFFLRLISISVPAVFHTGTILDDRFWLGMATLELLSFYQRWTPQVHSAHCMAFHLRSLPLSSKNLSTPRSLECLESPLTSNPPGLNIPVILLALSISLLPPPINYLAMFPQHNPTLALSLLPPRILPSFLQWLLSSPSQVGLNHPYLSPSTC